MAHGFCALGALAVASICSVASARPTAVRLTYQADPRIPDCPDMVQLKRSVEERLGAAPWDPDAERQVHVRVVRVGEERRASIEIRDRRGALLGQRMLSSQQADCRELAEAMALAISIAIDPLSIRQLASRPVPASARAENASRTRTGPARSAATATAWAAVVAAATARVATVERRLDLSSPARRRQNTLILYVGHSAREQLAVFPVLSLTEILNEKVCPAVRKRRPAYDASGLVDHQPRREALPALPRCEGPCQRQRAELWAEAAFLPVRPMLLRSVPNGSVIPSPLQVPCQCS